MNHLIRVKVNKSPWMQIHSFRYDFELECVWCRLKQNVSLVVTAADLFGRDASQGELQDRMFQQAMAQLEGDWKQPCSFKFKELKSDDNVFLPQT